MTNHQAGFTLIEMIVVTAVLGIVASVTAPNLFSSRTMANERAVVATLRNLATAQTQCMARAAVDTDGDGVGEALGLFELAGTSALRDGGAPLAPNAITASLGTAQPSGFVSSKGYLLALYLPDAAGNGVLATAANASSIDANGAEVAFTCLAGQRAHHEQREEAIALEHLAEIELGALSESVGPGVEGLLPAGCEQLVDLAAALGELAVREDAFLAHLHAANAALEPRRARDDVCHALPPRGQSWPGGAAGTAIYERTASGAHPHASHAGACFLGQLFQTDAATSNAVPT